MKNKIKIITLALAGIICLQISTFASELSSLDDALYQKSFYYYNIAYLDIMQLDDDNKRDEYLAKLNTITDKVWNTHIKYVVAQLDEIASTGSAKAYDDLQNYLLHDSMITDIDKAYFLGELSSWGTQKVWTDDYKQAFKKLDNLKLDLIIYDDLTSNDEKFNSCNEKIIEIYNDGVLKEKKEVISINNLNVVLTGINSVESEINRNYLKSQLDLCLQANLNGYNKHNGTNKTLQQVYDDYNKLKERYDF
jgi:hypothetical protein